jgi:hypothetical protein
MDPLYGCFDDFAFSVPTGARLASICGHAMGEPERAYRKNLCRDSQHATMGSGWSHNYEVVGGAMIQVYRPLSARDAAPGLVASHDLDPFPHQYQYFALRAIAGQERVGTQRRCTIVLGTLRSPDKVYARNISGWSGENALRAKRRREKRWQTHPMEV